MQRIFASVRADPQRCGLLPPVVSDDLEALWGNNKSALQAPSSRAGWRSKKVHMKRCQGDVHHAAFAHDEVPETHHEERVDDDLGMPGGSGAIVGPSNGHRAGGRGRKRRLGGSALEEQAEGANANRPERLALGRRSAEEVKLMRQYLASALEAFAL